MFFHCATPPTPDPFFFFDFWKYWGLNPGYFGFCFFQTGSSKVAEAGLKTSDSPVSASPVTLFLHEVTISRDENLTALGATVLTTLLFSP